MVKWHCKIPFCVFDILPCPPVGLIIGRSEQVLTDDRYFVNWTFPMPNFATLSNFWKAGGKIHHRE